jgi:triacylglycerol lipase
VKETGSPIIVVGHSLGGMLARYLGSRFPQEVRHVVTLGSPMYDALETSHPLVASVFHLTQAVQRRLGAVCPVLRPPRLPWDFFERIAAPLPDGVGFTAIFSKQDEVVDWRACLDPQGEHREVPGRHASLIVNPAVYYALAQTFAHLPAHP